MLWGLGHTSYKHTCASLYFKGAANPAVALCRKHAETHRQGKAGCSFHLLTSAAQVSTYLGAQDAEEERRRREEAEAKPGLQLHSLYFACKVLAA